VRTIFGHLRHDTRAVFAPTRARKNVVPPEAVACRSKRWQNSADAPKVDACGQAQCCASRSYLGAWVHSCGLWCDWARLGGPAGIRPRCGGPRAICAVERAHRQFECALDRHGDYSRSRCVERATAPESHRDARRAGRDSAWRASCARSRAERVGYHQQLRRTGCARGGLRGVLRWVCGFRHHAERLVRAHSRRQIRGERRFDAAGSELAVGFRPWSELSIPLGASISLRSRRTTSLAITPSVALCPCHGRCFGVA
jgi:hypothetical protein